MNMFKPTKAKTVSAYFADLPEARRKEMKKVHDLIRKTVPGLKSYMAYNMPGYGSFKYRSYKKELLDWPVISIASQKNYISLYVCALDKGQYLAEKYAKDLGKVSVGKSCIRFKKVDDLDLRVLKEVLKKAAKQPGLISNAKG